MKSKEETVRGLAADNWLKREKHFKEVYGLSVHEYHVSGHYMDGFKEGFDAGFQRAKEEFVGYLHKYREAYGEDICPPRRLEEFDSDVRTVVAFHMGRFLIDNMLRDVPEIGSELMPETSVPAEKPNATD